MILTIDIGNSRIKWAQWQAEVIIARGAIAYDAGALSEAFEQVFASVQRPMKIYCACVAGDQIVNALTEWVDQHWQLQVQFLQTVKQFRHIKNAYPQPESHGVDRWAGVVAAHLAYPDSACCIIGAGTATTFDFIDKNGQHLGGYILPSHRSMQVALLKDTAKVEMKKVTTTSDDGFPNNTVDAVNIGIHQLLQAGIRDFCSQASEVMGAPLKIIITGGGARAILDYPAMPEMSHKPDLVMQGLYSIMNDDKSDNNNDK